MERAEIIGQMFKDLKAKKNLQNVYGLNKSTYNNYKMQALSMFWAYTLWSQEQAQKDFKEKSDLILTIQDLNERLSDEKNGRKIALTVTMIAGIVAWFAGGLSLIAILWTR